MSSLLTLLKSATEASARGRMLRGVLANVYDKGAVTIIQLLTIPIVTAAWGAEGYGVWVMLMTVPTYIALADLGFGSAAGVVLTQCSSRGEFARANAVLNSTISFVMGMISIVAVAMFVFALWYFYYGAGFDAFSSVELAIAIASVTCYSLVLAQMNIVTVVYRATHKFAFAMVFSGTWILIEGLALVILTALGKGLIAVVLSYLFIRLMAYIIFIAILKRKEPWVSIDIRLADYSIIRELANPSVAALGLTFATAISLQGMVLALGVVAGPVAVALFVATRTLSRVPLQLAGLILRPSIPELTRAITEKNYMLVKRLNRLNVLVALGVSIPFSLVVTFWGPAFLRILSDGVIDSTNVLFFFLCVAAVASAVWNGVSAPLIAMNLQSRFSYHYLFLSILAILVVLYFSLAEVLAVAVVVALVELMLVIRVFYCSSRRVYE